MLVDPADQIVGWWFLFAALHAEPLWVDPAYRRAGTARRLLRAMRGLLQEIGTQSAFAIIGLKDLPQMVPLATKVGFERIPGELFFIHPRTTRR